MYIFSDFSKREADQNVSGRGEGWREEGGRRGRDGGGREEGGRNRAKRV
jgi:hypothetical protein